MLFEDWALISEFVLEENTNAGCNNGIFLKWNGRYHDCPVNGHTCACHKGCHGSDTIKEENGKWYYLCDD